MQRLFHDRIDAGRQLARKLVHLKASNPIILALPRGGVPVAAEVAHTLGAPLELMIVRKLGMPGLPEVAIGAVADGAHPRTVINWDMVRRAGLSEPEIAQAASAEVAEIERRRKLWVGDHTPQFLAARTVVIVDDGIATGASARVALNVVRAAGAEHIVLASPVASQRAASELEKSCDEAIFLATPDEFYAVSDYYADFHQLSDSEVGALLQPTLGTNKARPNPPPAKSNTDTPHPLIVASRVDGALVYNADGENIGRIKDLTIKKTTGKVIYALVSFGGFLGLGERFHLLPWNVLAYDIARDGYTVPLSREELVEAPCYSADELAAFGGRDIDFRDKLFGYYAPYGAMPYW
jgi:putative phosphoribosyl transferase